MPERFDSSKSFSPGKADDRRQKFKMQTALNLRKENAKLTSFCEPLPRFFCAGLRLELGFTEKIISSCWRATIRTCPSRDYGYPGQQTYRRFLPAFVSSSRWNR